MDAPGVPETLSSQRLPRWVREIGDPLMSCHRNLLGIALATMLAAAVFAVPAGVQAGGGSSVPVVAARC